MLCAVIGDRVFLAEHRATLPEGRAFHSFNTDDELYYVPYCDDFGPLNLFSVLRFVEILESKLDEYTDCPIVYRVDGDARSLSLIHI